MNEFVFKDKLVTNKMVCIRAFMQDKVRARSVIQLKGFKSSHMEREISWSRPAAGRIKKNFDGALSSNLNFATRERGCEVL